MIPRSLIAMTCLLTAVSAGCSLFQTAKGSVAITTDPEIQLSPGSQLQITPQIIQGELAAPFDLSWRVTLKTLQQSGYSIREATPEDGWIRTFDRQLQGPAYAWRESFSIRMTPINETHTRIKVRRSVRVYRPIFLVGPSVWMSKPSNGQRENNLIEHITQQLDATGVRQGEN